MYVFGGYGVVYVGICVVWFGDYVVDVDCYVCWLRFGGGYFDVIGDGFVVCVV